MPPEVKTAFQRTLSLEEEHEAWCNTVKWGDHQLKTMLITIKDQDWSPIICCISENGHDHSRNCYRGGLTVVPYNDADRILLLNVEDMSVLNVRPESRAFFNRLKRWLESAPTAPKDSLVPDLLTHSRFEGHFIHFTSSLKMSMDFGPFHIKSRANYAVYTIVKDFVRLVVIEKSYEDQTLEGMECQMIGELLIASVTRFSTTYNSNDVYNSPSIFGMLIHNENACFYKAIFSKEYLLTVMSGTTINPSLEPIVLRQKYSGHNLYSLSLAKANDRRKIVDLLSLIRQEIEEEVKTL